MLNVARGPLTFDAERGRELRKDLRHSPSNQAPEIVVNEGTDEEHDALTNKDDVRGLTDQAMHEGEIRASRCDLRSLRIAKNRVVLEWSAQGRKLRKDQLRGLRGREEN